LNFLADSFDIVIEWRGSTSSNVAQRVGEGDSWARLGSSLGSRLLRSWLSVLRIHLLENSLKNLGDLVCELAKTERELELVRSRS